MLHFSRNIFPMKNILIQCKLFFRRDVISLQYFASIQQAFLAISFYRFPQSFFFSISHLMSDHHASINTEARLKLLEMDDIFLRWVIPYINVWIATLIHAKIEGLVLFIYIYRIQVHCAFFSRYFRYFALCTNERKLINPFAIILKFK